MTAQKGRDLLVRMRKENTMQSYETIAGLRKRSLKFIAPGVDATHVNAIHGWRQILSGAGPKSLEVSGQGVFVDAVTDARLSSAFFELETPDFELVIPDFAAIRGQFLISELIYAGDHEGETEFSITLKSAGLMTMEAI